MLRTSSTDVKRRSRRSGRRRTGIGDDAGVEEVVPGVWQSGEAPVDAVGVCPGVGLLLPCQELPLPQRVDGGVRVLAELGQRRDVHQVHGDAAHGSQHALRHPVQPPVRADVHPSPVHDRLRLHRALDRSRLPSPRVRPAYAMHTWIITSD